MKVRKNVNLIKYFIIVASIVVAVSLAFFVGGILSDLNGTHGQTAEFKLTVTQGMSSQEIVSQLNQNGIIKNQDAFKLYSKATGNSGKYLPGTHVFSASMGYSAIIKELETKRKDERVVKVTIPEGYEFRQIVSTLEQSGLISREKFLDVAANYDFNNEYIKSLPKRENRLEGYLFPDTYEFLKGTSEVDIINTMLTRFNQIYNRPEYKDKASKLGMTTDQIVILASMIEREAEVSKDRPLISSVFYNRIKSKDMKFLQSCATVEYILQQRKPILSIADTKIKSPYNTYINPGLPVGPIANPGEASIIAALNPSDTKYLFFVGQKDGSHIFSTTYAEHLKAVDKANATYKQ